MEADWRHTHTHTDTHTQRPSCFRANTHTQTIWSQLTTSRGSEVVKKSCFRSVTDPCLITSNDTQPASSGRGSILRSVPIYFGSGSVPWPCNSFFCGSIRFGTTTNWSITVTFASSVTPRVILPVCDCVCVCVCVCVSPLPRENGRRRGSSLEHTQRAFSPCPQWNVHIMQCSC